jgi:hypothetical protein
LWDFVNQAVAVPLSYIIWLGGMVYRGTPQFIFWFFILGVIVTLALKGLSSNNQSSLRTRELDLYYPKRERVGFWHLQIYLARSGYSWQNNSSVSRFAEHFSKLALDTLAIQRQQSLRQVEQQIDQGEIELPAVVNNLMVARRRQNWINNTSWIQRLVNRIKNLYQSAWSGQKVADQSFGQDLEIAVKFLEDQLEVEYDHRDS